MTRQEEMHYLRAQMEKAQVSLRYLAREAGISAMALHRLLKSGYDGQNVLPQVRKALNIIVERRTVSYTSLLAAEDIATSSNRAVSFVVGMNRAVINTVEKLQGEVTTDTL